MRDRLIAFLVIAAAVALFAYGGLAATEARLAVPLFLVLLIAFLAALAVAVTRRRPPR